MSDYERFELYCLFMFTLIMVSLLLKTVIDRSQNKMLGYHCSEIGALKQRIADLEDRLTPPADEPESAPATEE